ncbi:MAG: hypothetical protein GY940_00685, partial [bacterium]|nr:hypothetical protein [bacterium]
MKKIDSKRLLKLFVLPVIILGLILIAIQVTVNLYEDELANYFLKKLEKKLAGSYSIRYENVDIVFFTGSVYIENLSVIPLTGIGEK